MDYQSVFQQSNYILAVGDAAAARLQLLDEIFGPATRELLIKLGLAPGWRVAEIGCGSGLVALWIAQRIGVNGSVFAVDISGEQLRVAKINADFARLENILFRQSSAYDTRLPSNSFDIVYSRFLLCHLTNPVEALREMGALLKKDGVLVCEDYDAGSITTDPPTRAYARLVEISRAVNAKRGTDCDIGLKLHRLFREAGFGSPEVSLKQTALLRGKAKLFWELTLREGAPSIIESGAVNAEELESICAELRAIAQDEKVLLVLARVAQVWARKE